MSRLQVCFAALVGATIMLTAPVKAASYNFTFDGTLDPYEVIVTGTLTTSDTPNPGVSPSVEYDITGIIGTVQAFQSGNPLFNSTIAGLATLATVPNDYMFPDNIFYYPANPSVGGYVDLNGLAFEDSLGNFYNIYAFPLVDPMSIDIMNPLVLNSGPDGLGSDLGGDLSLRTSVTPLPAALPLFATGLGAIGLLARRRMRKAAAAVA